VDNQRKPPAIQLGERFGKWPWELSDQPMDDVIFYTRIMGIDAEARNAMDGLAPDEEFYREE
jgi:hypothetical protein